MGDGGEGKPHYAGHRERLRERFLKSPAALPDYELLELILFRAVPRRDVKPLAKELIARFGGFSEVINAEPARLRETKGVSDAILTEFHIVRETGLRLTQAKVLKKEVIGSWDALIEYCSASMAHNPTEQRWPSAYSWMAWPISPSVAPGFTTAMPRIRLL